MARRFKQLDPAMAPRNHSAAARTYERLEDKKMDDVMTALTERVARGHYDDEEHLYLKAYAARMRREWSDWFDATSPQYIILGGLEEIRSLKRQLRWDAVITELKENDAAA